MRKIKIISQRDGRKEYNSAATTWGDLMQEIRNDFNLTDTEAVENIRKTTLSNVESLLPDQDFTIFIRPKKMKLGMDFSNHSYSELRDTIKTEGNACKDFLSALVKGKNWTQLTKDELRKGLGKYFVSKGGVKTTDKETKVPVVKKETVVSTKEVVKKVESIQEEKKVEEKVILSYNEASLKIVKDFHSLIVESSFHTKLDLQIELDDLIEEIESTLYPKEETEEERDRREMEEIFSGQL
jgi:hypothetical protein